MVSISELVDPFQVRNVLTVSEADLPNEVLIGYGLEDEVADDLDRLVPTWAELTEERHLRKLRLYAKYRAAAIVAVMAPVFILKKMTDGSNEGQRSDRDGFRWLKDDLQSSADRIMDSLQKDLEIEQPVETFDLVGRVIPERDPITEPREDVPS